MNLAGLNISEDEKRQLNEWEGYLSYIITPIIARFLMRPEKTICLYTGNQFGKTYGVAFSYVMRILGRHPVEEKNMRPDKEVRIYRFASETLPTETDDGGEIANTQYPAFKKLLPASLIKKDITARRSAITLLDPQGGPDITVEFVSYSQDLGRQAGVQRASVWLDEHASKTFYEEQKPRLWKAKGDLINTLTPALDMVSWEYDEFFEKASVFIRTPAIQARIFERTGKKVPLEETRDNDNGIAIIQAATDDNPIFNKEDLDKETIFDDPDRIDIRRYGFFRQVSGLIFKQYDGRIHPIREDKYFPDGIPNKWLMGRFIDYHEHVPWAVSFLVLSPDDEAFVWRELNPSPERMVTREIAQQIAHLSGDYKFTLNLIDPLAAKKQTNTGTTVIEDLNRYFMDFKKQGLCTGGYWQSWDTKSTRGRDEIRKRLHNSKIVGKPFNNTFERDGMRKRLPTLWVLDHCYQHKQSLKSWRIEQWATPEALVTKDQKDKPQQKYSHFPMCLEAAFKDMRFSVRQFRNPFMQEHKTPQKRYFNARVAR